MLTRLPAVCTGDRAAHFFVCTAGGMDMTLRSTNDSKPVLVAQVGPGGSFCSNALLGEGSEVSIDLAWIGLAWIGLHCIWLGMIAVRSSLPRPA